MALTRLRYAEAAEHFVAAARQVPPGHEAVRLGYLERQADALFLQGNETGDVAALAAAVERYLALLRLPPIREGPARMGQGPDEARPHTRDPRHA